MTHRAAAELKGLASHVHWMRAGQSAEDSHMASQAQRIHFAQLVITVASNGRPTVQLLASSSSPCEAFRSEIGVLVSCDDHEAGAPDVQSADPSSALAIQDNQDEPDESNGFGPQAKRARLASPGDPVASPAETVAASRAGCFDDDDQDEEDEEVAVEVTSLETVGEDFAFRLHDRDIMVEALKPAKRIKRRVPAESAVAFSTGQWANV